jgi:uncharacterized membrane protein YraQ (UPF0718 family)
MVTLLAATTLEKLKNVSPQFWLKVIVAVAALIAAIFVLRWLLQMNKLLLGIIIFVIVGLVGFKWIYERNEPAVFTPVVSWVAQFFPRKGSYDTLQERDSIKPGSQKKPAAVTQPTKAGTTTKK